MLRGFFHPSFLTPLSLMLLFIPTVFAAPIQSLLQTSLGEPLLDDTLALFPLKLEFSRGRSFLARIVVSTEQRCDAIPERGFPFSRALLLYSQPRPRLSRANSASTVDRKKREGRERKRRGERRDASKEKRRIFTARFIPACVVLLFSF